MENDENNDKSAQINNFFCAFKGISELSLVNTNLPDNRSQDLLTIFSQRFEKGQIHTDVGTVISVELGRECGCYYYTFEKGAETDVSDVCKFIICFVSENEQALDLFRADLDKYCANVVPSILKLSDSNSFPETVIVSLENWHTIAVEYMVRCKQAIRDSLKFLIYAALLDKRLVMSGGTAELQTDIQRFYSACSLSDILSQLRDSRTKQDGGSLSGSMDMLVDLDSGQLDSQATLTVNITADSVKIDSNGCNRFCEDWANTLSRPEFQENPVKLKQVIEAFKLKFIQTMNTLKRLLREAENDYYALYRCYVFLRESGNTEVLLHYVTTEGASDTANVLKVLQDFIQEQHAL